MSKKFNSQTLVVNGVLPNRYRILTRRSIKKRKKKKKANHCEVRKKKLNRQKWRNYFY